MAPADRLHPDDLDVLLRQDLSVFIRRCFRQLHPHTPLQWNWHLSLMADRLTRVMTGEIRRLIITLPPRSLKSIAASIAFPAWVLGHVPHQRLICVSYGQELAHKHARDTLTVLRAPWYQRLFPEATPVRLAADDLETKSRGGRMATSVGGVLTGRGGDLLIIDDPTKPDEVLSDAQRTAANDWYDHSLLSRLNDKQTGAIVLIMQRQHLDDLVGHVLAKGDPWETVNLPAMASGPEDWTYTVLGQMKTKRREPGEVLHPERESRYTLDALRQSMGSYVFEAQYQQSPVPLGGALVKTDWLQRYEAHETQAPDLVLQSWDTASKASELADYSVCTTWASKDRRAYLLHVYRERLDYPDLKRKVIEHQQAWNANVVLIEDKASGIQLIQELKDERLSAIEAASPTTDKLMRLQAQTPLFENGAIRLPHTASWLHTYETELTSFPRSRYKDQVDSTSQALAWLAQRWRQSDWTGPISVPGPNASFHRELHTYVNGYPAPRKPLKSIW